MCGRSATPSKATTTRSTGWDGKSWPKVSGGAVRIDVGPTGDAWVVTSAGLVFRYDLKAKAWKKPYPPKLPGGDKAIDISVGGDGSVMVSTAGGKLYALVGRKWVLFHGPAGSLSLDGKGRPWVTQANTDAIFALKTAVGGYKGIKAPKPKVQNVGDLTGAKVKFVPCEQNPLAPTWVSVAPKVNEDLWKKPHALPRDFWLVGFTETADPRCLDSHDSGEGDAPWFWDCGATPGKQAWQSIYVAPNKFAIYLPVRGLCLSDYRANGYEMRLYKCDFSNKQLFGVHRVADDPWNKRRGNERNRYTMKSGIANCLGNSKNEWGETAKGNLAYSRKHGCTDKRNGFQFSFWGLPQKN